MAAMLASPRSRVRRSSRNCTGRWDAASSDSCSGDSSCPELAAEPVAEPAAEGVLFVIPRIMIRGCRTVPATGRTRAVLGLRGPVRRCGADVVVLDLVVVVAVAAPDRTGVAHRQPTPPRRSHAGAVDAFGSGECLGEKRGACAGAVAWRRERLPGWRGRHVEHDRGTQRDPRPEGGVDAQVAWRQPGKAGYVGQTLDGDASWR